MEGVDTFEEVDTSATSSNIASDDHGVSSPLNSSDDVDSTEAEPSKSGGAEGEDVPLPSTEPPTNPEDIPKWRLMWLAAAQKLKEGAEVIEKNETVQKLVQVTNENVVVPVKDAAIAVNNSETVQKIKQSTNENIVTPVSDAAAPVWERTRAAAAPVWESTVDRCSTTSAAVAEAAAPVWESTKEKANTVAESAAPVWESTKERVTSTASTVYNSTREFSASAAENMAPTVRRASESASSLWQQTLQAASAAAASASATMNEVVDEISGDHQESNRT